MQVSVESTGKLERRMQVQVPAERVSEEIATRLKNLSRTARLKGFRPGKAPLTVIRQPVRPAGAPRGHRRADAVELRRGGQRRNSSRPAGSPRIEPQVVGEGQDLTYVATFEVLPGGRAAAGRRRSSSSKVTAEVTEADVDAMIERLRKQQMKYTRGDARRRRPATASTVDFDGTIDGVAVRRRQGRERRHRARRGHACSPQLEQGLVGAARGRERARSASIFRPITVPPSSPASTRSSRSRSRASRSPRCRRSTRSSARCSASTEGGVPKLREEVAANMRRELEQNLRNRNKTRGAREAPPGESDRGAERADRVADPRHADRRHAPHRRQGCRRRRRPREPFVEPARRRVALGLHHQRHHPPRKAHARSGARQCAARRDGRAATAMRRR